MQTKENLEKSVFEKLKSLQSDINLSIVTFGEIHIKRRELQTELQKLEEYEESVQNGYDKFTLELNTELAELQKRYPNGEIDLSDGTISFDMK
jgi:hypothetical protein